MILLAEKTVITRALIIVSCSYSRMQNHLLFRYLRKFPKIQIIGVKEQKGYMYYDQHTVMCDIALY